MAISFGETGSVAYILKIRNDLSKKDTALDSPNGRRLQQPPIATDGRGVALRPSGSSRI